MEFSSNNNVNNQSFGTFSSSGVLSENNTQTTNQQQQYLLQPSYPTDYFTPSSNTLTFSPNNFHTNHSPLHSNLNKNRRHSSLGQHTFSAGESEETPRPRLTREQSYTLERHFQQVNKPNSQAKRALAQQTGLTFDRVKNWFQNRRQKLNMQKRQETEHCVRILESAGQRRNTFTAPSPTTSMFARDDFKLPTKAQKSKSSTSPQTPDTADESTQFSTTAEASYRSLARSLAVAAAHAAEHNTVGSNVDITTQPTSPFDGSNFDAMDANYVPHSAFSDWGSSQYTPTPFGQLEDPFEYDRLVSGPSPYITTASARNPASAVAPIFQDNYSEFAAAIEMKAFETSWCMPLQQPPAPKKLLSATIEEQSEDVEVSKPDLRIDTTFATDINMSFDGSPFTTGAQNSPTTIASRRNCVRPASIGSKPTRTNSYGDAAALLSPEDQMRRIRSSNGTGRVQKATNSSIPRSPLRYHHATSESSYGVSSNTTGSPRTFDAESDSDFYAQMQSGQFTPATPATPAQNGDLSGNENHVSHSDTTNNGSTDKQTLDLTSPPATPGPSTPPPRIISQSTTDTIVPQPHRITDFHRIFDTTTPGLKESMTGDEFFNMADSSFTSDFQDFSLDMNMNMNMNFPLSSYSIDTLNTPGFFDLDNMDSAEELQPDFFSTLNFHQSLDLSSQRLNHDE